MAKTGRPRKPTVLKQIEGNPGKRALNVAEPTYSPAVPKPDDLTPVAGEWWDHTVPQLARLGLGQSVDLHHLKIIAEDYAEWDRASKLYRSSPPLLPRGFTNVPVIDGDGRPVFDGEGEGRVQRMERRPVLVTNPLWRIVRDAGAAYARGCEAFGLNAAARSRLAVPDRDFEDLDAGFEKWQRSRQEQRDRQADGSQT